MRAWVTRLIYLGLSGVAGGVVGYGYAEMETQTRRQVSQFVARFPLQEAAELAFRLGTPDQARTVLSLIETECHSTDLERTIGETRLALICEEQGDDACAAVYRSRVARRCHDRVGRPCDDGTIAKELDAQRQLRRR